MVYKEKSAGVTRLTGRQGLSLDQVWPIDSIYMSYAATNPGTLFGGTWARIANGRMLVGLDGTDVDFDTVGETGGEKAHTLTVAEMPAHDHSLADHTHPITRSSTTGTSGQTVVRGGTSDVGTANTGSPNGTPTSGSKGGGAAHNNMPPYLVVYIWRRTA